MSRKDRAAEWRSRTRKITDGTNYADVLVRLTRCGRCLAWAGDRRAHGTCNLTGERVSTHSRCEDFHCDFGTMVELVLDTAVAQGEVLRFVGSDGEPRYQLVRST